MEKNPDLAFYQPFMSVFVDVDPSNEQGDVPGYVGILNEPLHSVDDDEQMQIGTLSGTCIRIVGGEKWYCTGTYEMEEGSFSATGPFYTGFGAENAIVGGTRKYLSSSGQLTYDYDLDNQRVIVKVYFD